jgi:hypothetical protein
MPELAALERIQPYIKARDVAELSREDHMPSETDCQIAPKLTEDFAGEHWYVYYCHTHKCECSSEWSVRLWGISELPPIPRCHGFRRYERGPAVIDACGARAQVGDSPVFSRTFGRVQVADGAETISGGISPPNSPARITDR